MGKSGARLLEEQKRYSNCRHSSRKECKKHIPASAKISHSKVDKDKSTIDRVLVAVPAGKDGQITHYYCPRKSVVVLIDSTE